MFGESLLHNVTFIRYSLRCFSFIFFNSKAFEINLFDAASLKQMFYLVRSKGQIFVFSVEKTVPVACEPAPDMPSQFFIKIPVEYRPALLGG
jgi:hypothetical protein